VSRVVTGLERRKGVVEGRAPLDRGALAEVVELALWTGELLTASGAETQRVEESVRSIGLGLGGDWGSVVVTYRAIVVTYAGGGDFRTKARTVRAAGVDMSAIEAMSHLCHRADEGSLTTAQARAELERIERAQRASAEWQTTLAAGLGCAAFCRLFGGTWPAIAITFLASSLATLVRGICARRGHCQLLVTGVTALVAASIVGACRPAQTPEAAVAASVVTLVPGNTAICAVEDLVKGHVVMGLARATFAALVIVFAALGLLAAMRLTAMAS
jgi:uncharacterized membrane protein YjjP (DUF1212 family)